MLRNFLGSNNDRIEELENKVNILSTSSGTVSDSSTNKTLTNIYINGGIINIEYLNLFKSSIKWQTGVSQQLGGFFIDKYKGTKDIFFIDKNKNIGLGTNKPLYKLDVRGNINISGSTILNGDITLQNITSNSTTNIIYYDTNSKNISYGLLPSNSSLSTLNVSGPVTLLSSLNVSGNTILNNTVSINSSLNVSGNTILNNITTCLSSLNVSGNTVLNNLITIKSTLNVSGNTILNNSVTINSTLNVSSPITCLSSLNISGNTILNNLVTINSTLNVSGNTILNSAVTNKSTLINIGATTCLSTLNVSGITVFNNAISINSTLNLSGYTIITSGNIGSQSVSYANSAGSVSIATNAYNLYTNNNDSTNSTYYIPFYSTYSGWATPYGNTKLNYNPSSNTITCDIFKGNLSGNALDLINRYSGSYGLWGNSFYNTYGNFWSYGFYTNGNFGVGASTPEYPLTVLSTYNKNYGPYGYLNSGGSTGYYGGTGTNAVSIYAAGRILCSEFNAVSDIRVKTNIIDVDDISALEVIRQIQPKKYNYIDVATRGNEPVWGFIAQQIKSVLPYSTKIITDYIPNIYDFATINNNTIIFNNIDTSKIILPTKLKLYTDDENNSIKEVIVNKIIDNKTIEIKESLENITKVFVYGQQVDDFHVLNKDAIYAVSVAALQEVDRQQQKDTKNIIDLTNRIEILEKQNSDLLLKNADLLSRLEKLEQLLLI